MILNPRIQRSAQPHQGGYVLLLGLVLILILTVFGLFAMNGSIMQERMAGSQRDSKVAFEAAEMTLRWGESWLQSRVPMTRPFPCQTLTADLVLQNCSDKRQVLDAHLIGFAIEDQWPWDGGDDWSNARPYGYDPETNTAFDPPYQISEVSSTNEPLFILEQNFLDRDDLAGNPQQGRVYYRIIAAANGARATTLSVLESKIAKRYE